MMTRASERQEYPTLDGVRALAALGVVFTHVGFASGRSIDNGPFAGLLARLDFGVTLFFLLSGFVIYRPYARTALVGRAAPTAGAFYVRRLTRIVPAYWLVIAVTLGLLSLRPARLVDWGAYLTLLQTYTGHSLDPSLTQMWTLSVELSFYALVPLFAWGARQWGRSRWRPLERHVGLVGGLLIVGLVGNIIGNQTSSGSHDSLLWLPANLDWFAAGMFLAIMSVVPIEACAKHGERLREIARSGGLCWTLAGLIFWIATLPIAGPRSLAVLTGWEWTLKHYLYLAAAFLILLPLTLAPERKFGSFLASRPLRILGMISYGIYLWHLPILIRLQSALGYRTFGGHFFALLGGTLALTILAASLSWLLLEKPLLALVRRRQRQLLSRTATATERASASSTSP